MIYLMQTNLGSEVMTKNQFKISEKQAKHERKRKIIISICAGVLALALILGIILDSFMYLS